MLNKHEINSLKENIEWAKLDAEKGSVYHIKWAQRYIEDVQKLLDSLYYSYSTGTEERAEEVLRELKKS
jgi:hypothetical protein